MVGDYKKAIWKAIKIMNLCNNDDKLPKKLIEGIGDLDSLQLQSFLFKVKCTYFGTFMLLSKTFRQVYGNT